MFILTVRDRKGEKLKTGDIVKVSNGSKIAFFSEVRWIADKQILAPPHTFSFHSFEKVDNLPSNAIESKAGEGYKCWCADDPKDDKGVGSAERYLIDWRQFEHLLENKCYMITEV